jgi:hypothetical protein
VLINPLAQQALGRHYTQQWNLLRRAGENNPNPRKSFCKDLDAFLIPLQAAGDELIVMGDLSEHLGDSASGMNAIVAKFGLVDSTTYHHGLDGELPTYSRSNNRLDYILCSHAIAPNIWRCGILQFNFVISSDHRGVFIDLWISTMSAALRGIRSTSPKACIKYVTAIEKYMLEHKVYSRVKSLSESTTKHGLTEPLQLKWEGVDQDILRASLHAENLVAKIERPPWSIKLHQASLRLTYWHIALSVQRTHRAVDNVLEVLALQIEWDPTPPPETMTIADIQTQLRSIQAELMKIRKEASSLQSDMLQEPAAAEACLTGNDEAANILQGLERAEATKTLATS